MRIELLGQIRAFGEDGKPIEISGARLRALLARLALAPGRAVRSDTLADDLWGADPPADAANALQALVSRLRRALGGAKQVEPVPGGYRLPAPHVDAARFEDLIARGRDALAADRPRKASELLGEALGLWRGTPLADLEKHAFAAAAAARWADLRTSAAEDRFEAELRLGGHEAILADLESESARHPLRERLAALRMRALAAAGRQSAALAVYEHVRGTLAEELGVDPGPELRAAHLAVLRGEYGTSPARAEPRLPLRLTSFVGREHELKQVLAQMETSRLVTIVGPGGAGKSRLAVEAVTRHPAYRTGRLWFVSLAAADTPERLVDVVLGTLRSGGARQTGPADPLDQVAELIQDGAAVLVLDDCERLVEDVAHLAHGLLGRLPYLTILATSRQSLAIVGEVLCPLGPLAEPPAARLFRDRAADVLPGTELDDATVADVCRRLDGLPLALELAAARLRSMSLEQIARRLDDRFRLLTSGNRTALPHQRTLHAVVEWSWGLLSEEERTLARRFAVFPGGAGEAAVEAVCGSVYVLGSLVEKSFVVATGGRYRMLETIRAYAEEELRRSGEQGEVRARFIRHFRLLAEENELPLRSRDQLRAFAALDADYDNLLFAVRAAIADGDADAAWRPLPTLWWYWYTRFDARSEKLLAEVLAFGDALPGHARALLAALLTLAGDRVFAPAAEARPLIEECIRTGVLERFVPAVPLVLAASFVYGFADLVEDELAKAGEHRDPWARASASWMEATVRGEDGDWEGAMKALAEALRRFDELGERTGLIMTLGSLARVHSIRGEHEAAIAALERSSVLAAELGIGEEIWHRTGLAAERSRAGDREGAWREAELARSRVNPRARQHAEIGLWRLIAALHRRTGELEAAERAVDELAAMGRGLSMDEEAVARLVATARLANLLAAGQARAARALFPVAVRASLNERDAATAAELLARLLLLEGDAYGAATALGLSQAIRGAFDQGEPELAALAAELTALLGAQRYERAYREGAGLPRDEALAKLSEPVG
ncbi:BTAD domain-containing putative transcriptional regulator [Nonomuraea typhae]|uniref:BTAD domain-containing putative transcriptional regulator n=1 Tax=Nonomuraea typhae TaxID=2603600 RepID=UPI0012F9C473|nr:BTAD domain-containing putative transcriptional regulator [Nonomuraea typhae]